MCEKLNSKILIKTTKFELQSITPMNAKFLKPIGIYTHAVPLDSI